MASSGITSPLRRSFEIETEEGQEGEEEVRLNPISNEDENNYHEICHEMRSTAHTILSFLSYLFLR